MNDQARRLEAQSDFRPRTVPRFFRRGQHQQRAGCAHVIFKTVAQVADLIDNRADLVRRRFSLWQDFDIFGTRAHSHSGAVA